MKNLLLRSSIFMGLLASTPVHAQCFGDVYTMNAGRGHLGIFLDLQERKVMSSQYFSDAKSRQTYNSTALFSASSMSYDSANDRLYYASTPIPTSYHIDLPKDAFSEEQLNNLDLHAKTTAQSQLAYFNPSTNEHTAGPTVKKQILRMAFKPGSDELYASDSQSIFKVNADSGEVTEIRGFPDDLKFGGFTSWGDFVFQDSELLFVTNNRTFSVDTETGELTFKAFHYTDFITTATLDQNGQMLIAAKNQNVSGNINSNILYRLKPSTGETVRVGLFPSRISAMGTITSQTHTCYEETVFPSDLIPNVDKITLAESTVTEGDTAFFTIDFDRATPDETTIIRLALKNGTATTPDDFSKEAELRYSDGSTQSVTINSTLTEVTLPKGVTSLRVGVDTVNDSDVEENETFSLQAWFQKDKSDTQTSNVTIEDNDPEYERILQQIADNSGLGYSSIIVPKDSLVVFVGFLANISVPQGTKIPPGVRLEIMVPGYVSKFHDFTGTAAYYHSNYPREYFMGEGQIAWARFHYNGKTYNLKLGVKQQWRYPVQTDCSNGC